MNKELRKVLELDGNSSHGSDSEEEEEDGSPDHPPVPPTPTPGSAPKLHPAALNGFPSPEKSLLASLSRPPTRDGKGRSGHVGGRGSSGGVLGGGAGVKGGRTPAASLQPKVETTERQSAVGIKENR